jgi:ribosome-binding factor A
METRRTKRLNSLLKEVISEVIKQEVSHPNVSSLATVTSVEITPDLHNAKVSISVIGTEAERKSTVEALEASTGFIGMQASKKVVMRYFPTLTFKLDTTIDDHMKIEKILQDIHQESSSRQPNDNKTIKDETHN